MKTIILHFYWLLIVKIAISIRSKELFCRAVDNLEGTVVDIYLFSPDPKSANKLLDHFLQLKKIAQNFYAETEKETK